ncbi:MAG: hypothetical protein AAF529_18400 [Pseudomonadota bacterium]
MTSDHRTWNAIFELSKEAQELVIELRIRLIADASVPPQQLRKVTARWHAGVAKIWGEVASLESGGRIYPIRINVRFVDHNAHHHAIVHQNANIRIDQLNWSIWSEHLVIAHEVGHMLGAYDEYAGGSLNPDNPLITNDSIMSGQLYPRVFPRHLELIRLWAEKTIGPSKINIIQQVTD